jgi:hypothetical protein
MIDSGLSLAGRRCACNVGLSGLDKKLGCDVDNLLVITPFNPG